jgi:hypothetical protein
MAIDPENMSLDQIRAKQRDFLDELEGEVKKRPEASIDPVAIGQRIGLPPILTVEFIYYWVGMGRLDREWSNIAKNLQEQMTTSPLKPPRIMVPPRSRGGRRIAKVYSEEQRKAYAELWQDILALLENLHTAQIPFNDRSRGADFHRSKMQPGFDGITKVDRLSPYLEEEHYHLLRDYFNAYCNYHQFRREKYLNLNDQEPSAWTEQDVLLYKQVFTSGRVQIEKVFREVLAGVQQQEAIEMQTILFLAANPKNSQRLRLDEEVKKIEQGLDRARHRDQFKLVQKWAVTAVELRRALLDERPEIVHFSGHGSDASTLILEDDQGMGKEVPSEALSGLFKLCSDHVRCVMLNACYSEVQATAISNHIEYVVGMSQGIGDDAAISFSVGFYDALGAGADIQRAFEFGQNAISLLGIPEGMTPVLKTRL